MTLLAHALARFPRQTEALAVLLDGVDEAQATWRPADGAWCLREVAGHLLDEEREDFRVRLDLTLHRPGEAWPGIDPEGWVTARRHAERDIGETLAAWRDERRASLTWLRGLRDPDWDAAHEHPSLGRMRAGDLLLSWLAHDLLHLRQVAGLHHAWAEHLAAPYDAAYAGGW